MTEPLSADKLRKIDAYWRAANYLSVGQIYLLDNPLLKEPLQLKHVKAAPVGPLGHDAGAELRLRASESDHSGIRPGHDLHLRSRARRAGAGGQHVSRGNVQRALSGTSRRTKTACGGCSSSSRFPAGFPATSRPKRRARSTKGASWATA